MESIISISVKPILIDKGYFSLSLNPDVETQPCTVYIDDNFVNYKKGTDPILDMIEADMLSVR